jgi:hypothetical protein
MHVSVWAGVGAAVATVAAAARSSPGADAASTPPAAATSRGGLAPTPRAPVVSFHVDRPYLDTTGKAQPYLPPRGTRSGQQLAELTHVELLSRYGYF